MAERDDLARVLWDARGRRARGPVRECLRDADAILAQWMPEHDRAIREQAHVEQLEQDVRVVRHTYPLVLGFLETLRNVLWRR